MPDQRNPEHAAQLHAEMVSLIEEQNQVIEEHQVIATKFEKHTKHIEELKSDIENLNYDKEIKTQTISTLSEANTSLIKENEELKAQNKDLLHRLQEMENRLHDTERQRDNYQIQLLQKEGEIIKLKIRIDELTHKLEALDARFEDEKVDIMNKNINEALEIIEKDVRGVECFVYIKKQLLLENSEIKNKLEELARDCKLTRKGCAKKFLEAFPEFKPFTSNQESALKKLKSTLVTEDYQNICSRLQLFETEASQKFQKDLLSLDDRKKTINDVVEKFLKQNKHYKRYQYECILM